MDSHLNPDAAEFVPVSPTHALSDVFGSDLISGSPLKQSQRALTAQAIPSEEEFKEEISSRPSDIDDTTMNDFPNGGDCTPLKSSFIRGGFEDSRQATVLFDDSEVSSTKAEFGDDTVANFSSTTSELYKTGVSNIDSSFTGSDRGGFDFSSSMTTSMTPSDFKTAFEQDPDLNQVHELKDEDLPSEVLNGIAENKPVDEEEDDLGKDQIDLDMEKLPEHQKQNIEVFAAEVEERYNDNKDLFMNQLNTENSNEFEKSDNLGDFSSDAPAYATSNPFSSGYDAAPASENEIQNLAEGLQKVNIEEPEQQQQVNEDNLLNIDEQEKTHEEVMQNPLDLNFGLEKNIDPVVLLSPIKDPEVMSSKYAEEENISAQQEQDDFFSKTTNNHMEDLSSAPSQQVNLSESLQEFTGLESQLLSPKINNGPQEPQILKENLVDELKDVEEISPSSVSDEVKEDVISPPTNELSNVLSNEIIETKEEVPMTNESIVVGAAAAVAATAAVAAAATKTTTKSATAVSKTGKPAASKPATRSSTLSSAKTTTAPAKKPAATSAAPRAKSAVAATKPPASTANKPSTTRTSIAPKTATSTAAKAPSRPATAGAAAPKPRPLSSVTSKVSSTSTDKKATTNGTASKPPTASRTATKPPTTNATSKTSLVSKAPATSRPSTVGVSAATTKPRPASATAAKTSAKPSLTASGLSNNTARPKTAPASTLNAAAKSKLTAKSPMIDKQIKETANKQISSARVPAAGVPKTRQSLAPSAPSSTTKRSPVTTKTRMSLAPPKTTNTAAQSPIKKPAVTNLKPNLKNVTSKVNSKVTSTTKTTVTSTEAEIKPVQNGNVCESNETVVTSNMTTTTVTTNIEEDLPKKDVSPIEQPTDNQLISAE